MINAVGNRMTREIARQQKLADQIERTQIQISSGKRLQRMSDDPVSARRIATIGTAWVQFPVPVGLMRVGRMPSHWGMGLLANGGGTGWMDPESPKGEPQRRILDNFFDDDFGDNHFGSSADRILFITKPITIYRTLKKLGKVEHPLVVGYAFDKLSEAPLLPFEAFER